MQTKTILILQQIRVKHWIKNLIIFMPLFFSGMIADLPKLIAAIFAFLAFSFTASVVYVINDLSDIEEDRKHKEKRKRPLASGKLSVNEAKYILLSLAVLVSLALILIDNFQVTVTLTGYLILNLLYTFRFKTEALLDIFSVSAMYLLRLVGGSVATGIIISGWLFVTILFGSLLLIVAKRYSEIKNEKVRKVLESYTKEYLAGLLLLAAGITITAFVVYSISLGLLYLPAIILFTFAIFRYLLLVETTTKGEKPEELLVGDKQTLTAILLLFGYIGLLIYLN